MDPQHSNNFGWFYKAEGEGELYKYKQTKMNVFFFKYIFKMFGLKRPRAEVAESSQIVLRRPLVAPWY